jgi:hypothetical protein
VEAVLPHSVQRTLTDQEMAAYRAPFLERDARLPTLVWPRQIPIEGEPADVTTIVDSYGKAMSQSALPKLLIVGELGALLKAPPARWSRDGSSHVTAPCGRECLRTGRVNAKSTQQPEFVTFRRWRACLSQEARNGEVRCFV